MNVLKCITFNTFWYYKSYVLNDKFGYQPAHIFKCYQKLFITRQILLNCAKFHGKKLDKTILSVNGQSFNAKPFLYELNCGSINVK